MTENKGDLISRKTLKEVFINRLDEGFFFYSEVIELIDNAPTVEPEKPPCNQIAWEQGYEAGVTQGKSERPKGVWIISQTMDCHSDIINIYTCPFCGKKRTLLTPFVIVARI